jgi:hypothetical protein
MLEEISAAIHCKVPTAVVNTFGSHALGLSVFFSDLDVSILGMSYERVRSSSSVEIFDVDEEITTRRPGVTSTSASSSSSASSSLQNSNNKRKAGSMSNSNSEFVVQPFLKFANVNSLLLPAAKRSNSDVVVVDLSEDVNSDPEDVVGWSLDTLGDKEPTDVSCDAALGNRDDPISVGDDDEGEDDVDVGLMVIANSYNQNDDSKNDESIDDTGKAVHREEDEDAASASVPSDDSDERFQQLIHVNDNEGDDDNDYAVTLPFRDSSSGGDSDAEDAGLDESSITYVDPSSDLGSSVSRQAEEAEEDGEIAEEAEDYDWEEGNYESESDVDDEDEMDPSDDGNNDDEDENEDGNSDEGRDQDEEVEIEDCYEEIDENRNDSTGKVSREATEDGQVAAGVIAQEEVDSKKRKRKLSEDFGFNIDKTSTSTISSSSSSLSSSSSKPAAPSSSSRMTNWGNTDLSNGLYFAHTQLLEEKELENRLKLKHLDTLRALFAHIKSLGWVKSIELRSKAKVPIINMVHHCGVHVDISMGLSAEDTTDKIRLLYSVYPEAFLPLACFLKVFLYMNELDKPYTGGIGSYKLYVMIAFILSKIPMLSPAANNRAQQSEEGHAQPDLGYSLLAFFKYFGNKQNLNLGTSILVHGVDAAFDKTFRVDDCRQLFQAAHDVLLKKMQEIIRSNVKNKKEIHNNTAPYLVSNSVLGMLLDTKVLKELRDKYAAGCNEFDILPREDKIARANEIIKQLLMRKIEKRSLKLYTYDDVVRVNPVVACKLLSYPSVESALAPSSSSSSSRGMFKYQQFAGRSQPVFDEMDLRTNNFNRKPRFEEYPRGVNSRSSRGRPQQPQYRPRDDDYTSLSSGYYESIMQRMNDKYRKHSQIHKSRGGQQLFCLHLECRFSDVNPSICRYVFRFIECSCAER